MNGPKIHAQTIDSKSTSHVIGTIFLHSCNAYHQKAEIAFNLALSHWSQAYTSQAADVFTGHAFSNLDLNRIDATCMLENVGATRVLGCVW